MDRRQRPLFRPGEGGIDEGFGEIEFAAVAEILREPLQQPVEPAAALPLLKAAMTGLIRRIAARQIVPRRPGAEHPEHAVQHRARIGPGPAASIGAPPRTEGRFEHGPLGVGEVHAVEYDGDRNGLSPTPRGFKSRLMLGVTSLALLVVMVFFGATLVRSALGFGEALIAVPMLAFVLPVEVAAPVATVVYGTLCRWSPERFLTYVHAGLLASGSGLVLQAIITWITHQLPVR